MCNTAGAAAFVCNTAGAAAVVHECALDARQCAAGGVGGCTHLRACDAFGDMCSGRGQATAAHAIQSFQRVFGLLLLFCCLLRTARRVRAAAA